MNFSRLVFLKYLFVRKRHTFLNLNSSPFTILIGFYLINVVVFLMHLVFVVANRILFGNNSHERNRDSEAKRSLVDSSAKVLGLLCRQP